MLEDDENISSSDEEKQKEEAKMSWSKIGIKI